MATVGVKMVKTVPRRLTSDCYSNDDLYCVLYTEMLGKTKTSSSRTPAAAAAAMDVKHQQLYEACSGGHLTTLEKLLDNSTRFTDAVRPPRCTM